MERAAGSIERSSPRTRGWPRRHGQVGETTRYSPHPRGWAPKPPRVPVCWLALLIRHGEAGPVVAAVRAESGFVYENGSASLSVGADWP